jgi:hypothetical protein
MILYYLNIGVLLSLFNLLATMAEGATYHQALRVEAFKSKLPHLHWLLVPLAIVIAWPINLSYTLAVLLHLLPAKTWRELADKYEDE